MGDFRRTRSKVWYANYSEEDDETDDNYASSLARSSASRFSWRRSLSESANNRNSSSSPSNGSHKSQDSGFSDSESSSPSTCGSGGGSSSSSSSSSSRSKSNSASSSTENSKTEETTAIVVMDNSKLPETPVKITRPYLLRHRKKDARNMEKVEKNLQLVKSKCNSISSYLAECYFPITSFVESSSSSPQSSSTAQQHFELPSSSSSCSSVAGLVSRSYYSECASSSTPTDAAAAAATAESKTCFIVDELPKKTRRTGAEERTSSTGDGTETVGSYSAFEDGKTETNDTVRYVGAPAPAPAPAPVAAANAERTQESCPHLLPQEEKVTNAPKTADCNETLDISLLSAPAHTSTPKKHDTKALLLPRSARKIRRTSLVVNENRPIDPPVARWLCELRHRYEPECMTTLQAKAVSQYVRKYASSAIAITDSADSVLTFQHRTKAIANEFLKLYEKINLCAFGQTESSLKCLINHVMEFIISYSQLLPRMESLGKENLLKLMDMCDRLGQTKCPFSVDQPALLNDVNILEKFFSRFVDSVLIQHITHLTSVLETPNNESALLNALSGITSLSADTSRTCELITHLNGIQNLLAICLRTNSVVLRKAALRTLASVCQNAVTIRQLEKAAGIQILSQLLSDTSRSESELLEVISVLVQITAPWIEDDHVIKGLVFYLYPIIDALTRLISVSNSCETLLLSAAALANISFIEPQAVYVILQLDTTGCLLSAVRKLGVKASVFLQEQVATLLTNMAAVPETRPHLAQNRAVGALLCFLQVKHSPIQTGPEIAAAERLQHKSAIALSRLCTNPEISKQVIELQGVTRLVRLCREERERNYSDGVLVACLASLRKITANCGNEIIDQLNAKELVEPRLVDSFLLYSSRQESYV